MINIAPMQKNLSSHSSPEPAPGRATGVPTSQRRAHPAAALCGWLIGLSALLAPPAGHAADGDAIAIVNGQSITRGDLTKLLIDSHGLAALQQLIALRLAEDETRRLGIAVSDDDVRREYFHALERIAPKVGANGVALNDAQKREALRQILEGRGLSEAEFLAGMRRNAHLRKLVMRDFQVTDEALRAEFARSFGERVRVSHIQVNDSATLQKALEQLAGGAEFGAVARTVSQNPETAARDGRMAPFSFVDEAIPAALREAAFRLQPGEVSPPIRVENRIHILRLDERIPPENTKLEDVRAEVEQRLYDRALPPLMNDLLTRLFKTAKTNVLDAGLRPRYEELMKRNAEGQATVLP